MTSSRVSSRTSRGLPAGRVPADGPRRPGRGRSGRRGRPGLPGRSAARPGSAAWPSRRHSAGKTGWRTTSASSSSARGRSSARTRSERAGRADLHRAADVLDRRGQLEGRAAPRPFLEQAGRSGRRRPAASSRSQPASTYSSRATTPVPGRRSWMTRSPLSSRDRAGRKSTSRVTPRGIRSRAGGNRFQPAWPVRLRAAAAAGVAGRSDSRPVVQHACRDWPFPEARTLGGLGQQGSADAGLRRGRGSDQPTVRFVSAR